MTAKNFTEILKFNPYHGRDGRFASAGAATSFTFAPGKSRAHDLAIERHKERMAAIAPTAAQDKTLKGIESRTRNLKKEQFRVVDRDGNVVMQKQGDKTSVSYSIGEARDNFPGNVTIHNHPDGGTFSTADFSDFGYGATEIRAASPEGTYTLRNLNYKTKWVDGGKTWLDMRDDLDAASEGFKSHRSLKKPIMEEYEKQVKPIFEKWEKSRAEGASQEVLNSLAKEYTTKWDALKPQIEAEARAAYVGQYHSWLNSHAGEYGFEYSFTPTATKTRKSADMDEIEEIEKSTGEVVLDRKIKEDVDEILAGIFAEYPRTLDQKIGKSSERSVIFIGLKVKGADSLAIDGGEKTDDFHITLVYGHFDSAPHDESAIDSIVKNALDTIKDAIPEEIRFDEIKRFPASDGSDGKDVIYARVAEGQLEKIHEDLLKAFKDNGMTVEPTFPVYKPHMTLAYIEPGKDHDLSKIDETGKVTKFMIGYGKESSHEHNYTILKTDNDKRLVFGWASIAITVNGEQLEDRQKDMIDPEDLEESAYDYVLNFRDTGEEHIPTMRKKGKLVESCVFTVEKQKAMGIPEGTLPVGWWVGFKIEDDDAWERVKNGTYRMFSIEGKANREPIEKAARNYEEFQSYDMWLEENLDASLEEQKAAKEHFKKTCRRDVEKMDVEYIQEVGNSHKIAKTFDEILEIQKFNPYHDKLGRFTSGKGGGAVTFAPGKNRKYGQTDTSDAVGEIAGGKKNSLSDYMDDDGKLSPEREAVHKQIIDDMLKGKMPVDGQATMTMLGGGPASGKSSVMNPDTSGDKHAVTVDPDAFKQVLPGYKEMAAKDPNAASYYHEESSALAKRFAEVAFSENYNVIYDGTGDGSPKSVQKKIDGARAAGYKVEAKYVSIDTEEAVRRNQKRYDDAVEAGKSPRLVPAEYVRSCHAKVTDISTKMADQFDSIEVWDNNGARGQQKLIATGGSGKGLKAVSGQEAAFKSYLGKGTKGEAGFTTLPDGTVIPVE